MDILLYTFTPQVSKGIYLKDPSMTDLGKEIVKRGNQMISEIGFEHFTFKKLAEEIHTTEATIYRYFENKHKFLLYLTAYYWSWVAFQLTIKNSNLESHEHRLRNAIDILCCPNQGEDIWLDHFLLYQNIINESSKSYMIKSVDELNQHGVYYNYKKIVSIISDSILSLNPKYPYAHMLISTIIEGIHHQQFFARHLPSLTDKSSDERELAVFYYSLVTAAIQL